jgi:hypothetical protein
VVEHLRLGSRKQPVRLQPGLQGEMMKNLIKASIAMAAFAALLVVPSVASALTVTAPTGTSYIGNVIATNVPHANTKEHTLMTLPGGGAVTCDRATLTGKTLNNHANPIQGEITTAQFEGPNKNPECTSPFGNVTPTPNHTKDLLHNGLTSLPWCIKAGAENKFTLRGGTCAAPRAVTFALHTPVGECVYSKETVNGTYTTHPIDAIGTIIDQEFTKITGSFFCPASGKLDMAFTLTTDNNGAHGTPIYIDNTTP